MNANEEKEKSDDPFYKDKVLEEKIQALQLHCNEKGYVVSMIVGASGEIGTHPAFISSNVDGASAVRMFQSAAREALASFTCESALAND